MDDNDLIKRLNELHDEINNTQTLDEESAELLRDLEGDINALLERTGENPLPVHPSIVQRLERALGHFEVTHPDLTLAISKLLNSLSNAGI